MHVLDQVTWASLTGTHASDASLVERAGQAARYLGDVSPFHGLGPDAGERGWADLAALAGPGAVCVLAADTRKPPPGWEVVHSVPGVQLVDDGVAAAPDPEAVRLGAADVPEMLALVARTKPGPFEKRTIELGTYLGIRRDGELIAMAGERLRPPGWSEISAVCTDAAFRGHGLGTRLVLAMAHEIRARGETPFLHAAASNTGAIRLYEHLGFRLRKYTEFQGLRTPRHPLR